MDVSVVIPCYNRVELLKLTIKSVARAIDGLNAEIILVDDGSDPSISSRLDEPEYKDLPLKFLRHANSGLVYSKYVGMMAAAGRYIQFLDSDDQITADKLTRLVAAMDEAGADVGYTDFLICNFTGSQQLEEAHIQKLKFSDHPAEFYIDVQPGAHSPVYKQSYLKQYLSEPFIPVNRIFTAMGEVWMYYNLCIYPAKIIKINEPLSILVHHPDERMTTHWENMGIAALAIQRTFAKNVPETNYTVAAKKQIALAAFHTFRGLPYDIDFSFQSEFIRVWRKLGHPKPLGGRNYNLLSKLIGPIFAAIAMKLLRRKSYNKIRTMSDVEFSKKLEAALAF